MVNLNENALICDLAETYQIYDYRSLPMFTVAALSAGLRDNSRIMTIMRGGVLMPPEHILASIYDMLAKWLGVEQNKTLTELMWGETSQKKPGDRDTMSFDSPEEFWAARRKAIGME